MLELACEQRSFDLPRYVGRSQGMLTGYAGALYRSFYFDIPYTADISDREIKVVRFQKIGCSVTYLNQIGNSKKPQRQSKFKRNIRSPIPSG